MNRLALILSLFACSTLLNCSTVDHEIYLRNRVLPPEQEIPDIVKTKGKITYDKSDDPVVAKITVRKWSWFETKVNWPNDAPYVEEADVEIMDEKWLGGEILVLHVIHEGKTIYDATICEKHKVKMTRTDRYHADGLKYPVSYGTSGPKQYPNSGVVFDYGCASGLNPKVWRCSACHDDFQRWTKRLGISE